MIDKTRLYKQEGSFGIFQSVFPFLFTDGRMKEYLGTTYGEAWGFMKNNFGQIYLQEDKMEEIVEAFLEIAKDRFPEEWRDKWALLDARITQKAFEIASTNLELLTREERYVLYREIEELHEEMWALSIFIDSFDSGADQREVERISKAHGFTVEETQTLLSPTKTSYIALWDECLLKYKKGELTFAEVKEKFFWWRTDYAHFGELDEDFVLEASQQAHLTPFESPRAAQEKILEKYKLAKNPLESFQTLSLWRDERKRVNFTGLYGLERILAVSLIQQGIPLSLINGLLPEEAKDVIFGETIDMSKLIERIEQGFFAHFRDSAVVGITLGTEAEAKAAEFEKLFLGGEQEELRGAIACKGYAKGCVRVIFNAHDAEAEQMQEGEILVTSMTRPEFIGLMRKAAAFVTDEGGISCHAAIVAREMNKPCIIGTRVATKVLKTGDLVEVDANTGVVKIIERV